MLKSKFFGIITELTLEIEEVIGSWDESQIVVVWLINRD